MIDNPERRREALAALGRALAAGPIDRAAVDAAAPWIGSSGPEDLVVAVDTLVAEGIPFERLKPAVSRLINLLSKPLSRRDFAPKDPFFRSLLLENAAILATLGALKGPIARLAAARSPGAASAETAAAETAAAETDAIAARAAALGAIEIHYRKKENILFPHIEARYPRYRCLSLMWALHDDVREGIREVQALAREVGALARETAALSGAVAASSGGAPSDRHGQGFAAGGQGGLERLNARLGRLFFDIGAVAFREEKVLFPVVAPLLDPEELGGLFRESREYGFCLLDRGRIEELEEEARLLGAAGASRGAAAAVAVSAPRDADRTAAPAVALDAGRLTPELIDLVLKSLPLDLTFVDAQDRVRYFSNGEERVFPRSPSILGREVRNCHPAGSVERVMRIVDSFKSGERDSEEFWLQTRGRFVLIEYRALRAAGGEYLGTLEISQDLTKARALRGERRLAD